MRKLLTSLALLVGLLAAAPVVAIPKVGEPAPAFELPVSAERKIALKDFRGRWLVLYFYPKDMTSGCTIEAQRFQKDLAQYRQLGAEIVGISADALDSHALFSKKEGLTFMLASDPGGKVAKAYDSWYGMGDFGVAARNTYLIDPEGRIARVFSSVDPTNHSQEVLATLKQLQQSKAARG